MRINIFRSYSFLISIYQLIIQIIKLRILIDLVLKMTGALFILQISNVLSQHFLGLITNPEIRPVI